MITFHAWVQFVMRAQRTAHALTLAREAMRLSEAEIQEPHNQAAVRIETERRRIDPTTIPAAFVLAWGLTVAEKEARP